MMQLSSLWVTRHRHRPGSASPTRWRPAPTTPGRSPSLAVVTDRVYRLLRALTCGIVTESAGGKFALTPLGRMLTSNAPNSMRTSAELLTEYNGEIWGHLDGALEGGIAFEALKGKPLFNWLHANPEEGARFQRMMFEVHSPETPAIVTATTFRRSSIIDVGGRRHAVTIIAAHPGARHAVRSPGASMRRRRRRRPLPVTFTAGDVFESSRRRRRLLVPSSARPRRR
jgi:hypothetical protein